MKNKDFKRSISLLKIPSKGLFYKSKKDFLLLKDLSAYEENILCDNFLMQEGDGIKMVLENIIVDEDVNIEELLTGDIQAVALFLRSRAYGDNVDVKTTCPKCGNKHVEKVKLSSYKIKDFEESEQELRFDLFDNNEVLVLKMPTFIEEMNISKKSDNFIDKIIECSISFGEIKDRRIIASKLLNMPIIFSKKLRKEYFKKIPGVNNELSISCENCDHNYIQKISGDFSFLKLPEEYKENLLEERFLITHYSEGGISWDETLFMTVNERRWILNRLKKENDKKNSKIKSEKNKTRGKYQRGRR
jgi:hypothetical protein